jgi:hypothetical protein
MAPFFSMIGPTLIDEHMKKTRLLYDAMAWFESNSRPVLDEVIRMIQEDQLKAKGVDENNTVIGSYSEITEMITAGRKQAGDHYTLEDTGEFFRSMYVTVLMDSIVINGDYGKMQGQDWWRNEILGLTDENLEKYSEKIREGFIKYARKVLEID